MNLLFKNYFKTFHYLRTWGLPEYGQLGHNSEGNYLEKSGKVLFHYVYEPTKVVMYIEKEPRSKQVSPVPGVTIKEISCGANHTVVIDDRFRVSLIICVSV